jgi:hypothetical protein
LGYLVEVLTRDYPPDHEVIVYEASHYPVFPSLIQRTALADLRECRINTHSTLWVPPLARRSLDSAMLARLRPAAEAN